MIRCYDKHGNVVEVETIECTADGSRRLVAALNASTTTVPYGTIRLPRCGVKAVRVVTAKAATPKPKHQAAFPDSDLGNPKVER